MNALIRGYLVLYNLGLTLGWAYVMYLAILQRDDFSKMWSSLELPLKIFQTAAVLEILHAAVGIVKSNPFLTFFQVFSRLFVVWGVLNISPPSQVSVGVPALLAAWTITEIIRYGYYFLNSVGLAFIIQWFRYTLFIVLYPIGVSGELICVYFALDYVKKTNIWSLSMPNAMNFIFNYHIALIGIMFMYIPIFPVLYGHMLTQRKKVLGGGSTKSKTN